MLTVLEWKDSEVPTAAPDWFDTIVLREKSPRQRRQADAVRGQKPWVVAA